MSEGLPISHGHLELHHLRNWIDRETIPSYDITTGLQDSRRGFVPRKQVRAYFTKDRYRAISSILRVILGDQSSEISARDVAENCSRIFCILYLINKANFIPIFVHFHSLFDRNLPFWDKPPNFPTDPSDANDGHFFKAFYDAQWRFCAPQMPPHSKLHYESNQILPIVSLERVANGNSGIVYKAFIHSGHDELLGQKHSPVKPTLQPNRCYAIKTFNRGDAQQSHYRESTAFTQVTEAGMRSTPGMIRFFGSFSYKDTFSIVLEYADTGNLENYFKTMAAPQSPQETIAFWSQLLEITKAISGLHTHHVSDGQSTLQEGQVLCVLWK